MSAATETAAGGVSNDALLKASSLTEDKGDTALPADPDPAVSNPAVCASPGPADTSSFTDMLQQKLRIKNTPVQLTKREDVLLEDASSDEK